MAYSWLIPLIACIANSLLAIIVYWRSKSNPVNRLFAVVTVTIISWNLNIFSLYFFRDPADAFFWSKVFRTGTLVMPPTIVHLFLVFGDRRSGVSRAYLTAAYCVAGFLVIANALDWLVADVKAHAWGYYPVAHRLYLLHVVSVVVNFGVAAVLLVTNILDAPSAQRQLQAKFWLLGAGIGIVGGMTNLLPIYHIQVYPVGNLANVAYTSIVAYAILRHRLMDIDVVVAKIVSYGIAGLLLITPAFGIMMVLQRWTFAGVDYDFSAAMLLVFIGIGALFPTLRLRTEARVGRSLFPEKHEYRATLREFTRTIVRYLEREKLLQEVGSTLGETLGLERVAVFLWEEKRGRFEQAHYVGEGAAQREFEGGSEFVRWLERRGEAILKDEVEAGVGPGQTGGETGGVFAANGWEVCVPLQISGRLIGFLGLGRKRGLDAFAAQDLDLLDTLAAEAAIALENARLYEELRISKDLIQRASRLSALGTLAAGIAHEVRNPLVTIQTFFQLAPERLRDEEFATSFLRLTASEVQRICDLISELLSFAKSPAHALSEVDLDGEIGRVLTLLAAEGRKHGVSLEGRASGQLAMVCADPDQIRQVLINVVLNAIEATPAGGLVVLCARPIEHQGRRFWQVEVRDSGVGIPAGVQEDIFNPFFTTKSRGTGLGLSIAHQIVTEHGGFMTVESGEGVGSRFFIHLPAAVGTVEPAGLGEAAGIDGPWLRVAHR